MVNPKVKKAIINGNFLVRDMIEQIKYLTVDKRKGLDFWKRDTAKYVLNNFDKIISKWYFQEFKELLEICKRNPELSQLVMNAAKDNCSSIVNILNSSGSHYSGQIIEIIKQLNSDMLIQGNISKLYELADRDKVDITGILFDSKGNFSSNEEIRKEYMQTSLEMTKNGTLHSSDVIRYIKELSKEAHGMAFIDEYASFFISRTDSPMKTLEELRKIGIERKELKDIVNSRVEDVAKEMLGQVTPVKYSAETDKKQANVRELLSLMLQDLVKNENCDIAEIKKLSNGGYATVYEVGSKVIKIGRPPETYRIPRNSKRFLQPLVRTMQKSANFLGIKQDVDIEIFEKCDMSIPATDEEIYMIYKELREEGLIWTDAKKSNLGRLTKENTVHFKGVKEVHHGNVGFEEEKAVERLNAGELVILDLDYVYDARNPNIVWPRNTLSKILEKRYKNELKEQQIEQNNIKEKNEMER